jgi:hypothetical protein
MGARNLISTENYYFERNFSPSQWSRGLRCGSAAVCLCGLRFRIPGWVRMFVSCGCYVLRYLRQADHASRAVLPTLVRRCVCSRNLKNEGVIANIWPQRHRKKKHNFMRYDILCGIWAYWVISKLWTQEAQRESPTKRHSMHTIQGQDPFWIKECLYTKYNYNLDMCNFNNFINQTLLLVRFH